MNNWLDGLPRHTVYGISRSAYFLNLCVGVARRRILRAYLLTCLPPFAVASYI
jgi:hypothetical protein